MLHGPPCESRANLGRLLQSASDAAKAMKLEVSQPEGTPHQVDLSGPEVVMGRDPSCDLVLNDGRCSRRHAVIEDGPEGLAIRDAGSSNGIIVNGRRLERSRLSPGDTVRLGDTIIKVLPDAAETIAVPRASSPPRQAGRRAMLLDPAPPTITTLTVAWALSAPTCLVLGILLAVRAEAGLLVGALIVGGGLVLGAFGGVMAAGLRTRAPWAHHLQIVAAGLGLLVCPFTFASVTVLIYMLRPDVRAFFETGQPGGDSGAGDAELTFALSLLGMLGLGLVLTAVVLSLLSGP